MTYNEFVEDLWARVRNCPSDWRTGQAVFNVLDYDFGVARAVQFEDGVDCFYNDYNIQDFIDRCWVRICSQNENH